VFPPWLSLDVPTVSLGDPTAAGWELCSSRRAALRLPGNPASPDAGRAAAGTHSAHTDTTEIIRAGSPPGHLLTENGSETTAAAVCKWMIQVHFFLK